MKLELRVGYLITGSFSPSQISDSLSIIPSKTWKKGDLIYPKGKLKYKEDGCFHVLNFSMTAAFLQQTNLSPGCRNQLRVNLLDHPQGRRRNFGFLGWYSWRESFGAALFTISKVNNESTILTGVACGRAGSSPRIGLSFPDRAGTDQNLRFKSRPSNRWPVLHEAGIQLHVFI
jgi:hypothetical protein